MVDLEIANEQLRPQNKTLLIEYERKLAELKRKSTKTKNLVKINSSRVNIFIIFVYNL